MINYAKKKDFITLLIIAGCIAVFYFLAKILFFSPSYVAPVSVPQAPVYVPQQQQYVQEEYYPTQRPQQYYNQAPAIVPMYVPSNNRTVIINKTKKVYVNNNSYRTKRPSTYINIQNRTNDYSRNMFESKPREYKSSSSFFKKSYSSNSSRTSFRKSRR